MKKALIPVIIVLVLVGLWIGRIVQQYASTNAVILTPAQIEEYNDSLLAQGNLHLVDIEHTTYTIDQVRALIESYTVTSNTRFIDTDTIRPEDIDALLLSRNLEALPDTFIPRYGLTCLPADVRSFPTYQTLTKNAVTSGPFCFDYNQQTQLLLGEGVMILHHSQDSSWLFVQAYDYAGWVPASTIVPCSYDQMVDYLHPHAILVSTRIYTQMLHGDSIRINMGTILPAHYGKVLLPERNAQGTLTLVPMQMQGRWHRGYVPYTKANIQDLALSHLGNPYDWGNRMGYNDCTGFVRAVYRCFGVRFPRNSSDFRRIQLGAQDFDASTVDWHTLPYGTILMSRSHAVMYLGVIDDVPTVIHSHCDTYHPETGITEPVGRVECTPIVTLEYADGSTLATSILRQVEVKDVDL